MTVHNYRSRQVHETLNGVNPSSGFRDMGSAKSGPSAAWFDKFLAHGQAHMGQMGKWPWRCTTTGLDNSTELRMEKIHQAVTEIWVPQIWQPPARPPARTVTTIPLQPGGLRGKNRGRRPRFLSLLRPEGHVIHTAWETMIKSYYSTLADWLFPCFYSHKYEF